MLKVFDPNFIWLLKGKCSYTYCLFLMNQYVFNTFRYETFNGRNNSHWDLSSQRIGQFGIPS